MRVRYCYRLLLSLGIACLGSACLGSALCVAAETKPATPAPLPTVLVKAGKLLDVRKGTYTENAAVLIEGERIKEVGTINDVQLHATKDTKVIDLSHSTVMPGLIDVHSHLTARFAEVDDAYILSLAKKSQAFRALEGAANARITLHAGFTTVRDMGSEGAGYADVALRDAIKADLVEGPRMQVATRGIAALGQYNPFHISPDIENFPTGTQMISGVEEARRAAREQIANGADLLKVYADWSHPTLTFDEILAIVEEAHKAGLKVAAHATTPDGIRNSISAGVDSIEHGHEADQKAIDLMKKNNIPLVPTVGVIDLWADHFNYDPSRPNDRTWIDNFLQSIQREIQMARAANLKIVAGSDASRDKEQGQNALELVGLVRRGLPPIEAIRAATVNAAELMSWQDRVGAVEAGKFADLIAVDGDPLVDIKVLEHVKVVIKGGTVVKDEQHP